MREPRFTNRKEKTAKADPKEVKKKKSFFEKLANRLREAADLFGILVNRPKEFPSALLGLAKRFIRNIWDVRGGGLAALVAMFIIFPRFLKAPLDIRRRRQKDKRLT